jgi:hypothetical protein
MEHRKSASKDLRRIETDKSHESAHAVVLHLRMLANQSPKTSRVHCRLKKSRLLGGQCRTTAHTHDPDNFRHKQSQRDAIQRCFPWRRTSYKHCGGRIETRPSTRGVHGPSLCKQVYRSSNHLLSLKSFITAQKRYRIASDWYNRLT